MNKKLLKDIEFIVEIDKMKTIFRQTKILGEERRENDAEHSWHISMMALILEEYSNEKIDIMKVIKMLLIHDLVEIYAGDTFCYDEEANSDKKDRELEAAEKIYGMMDEEKGEELKEIWKEFEYGDSEEAVFAAAMDRLQPMLNNYYGKGGTWVEFGIYDSQIIERAQPIKKASDDLWEFLQYIIKNAIEKGYVKGDTNS